ncbi:MAG: hypothetical protein JXB20_03920 [Bacilli bacterium]|nr:hypothetical protein [Bacilli bacterium]MBN2696087.1 hypothetical protein [Bacilli bacterium]
MNDLIERYIYDVTKRLPESSRAEVEKELQANIEDMLPKNYDKDAIIQVLKSLGEPRILASEYRQKKRYLISPEWMDDYLRVLKIVLIIFGSISLVFGIIDSIVDHEATMIIGIVAEVFGKTISEVIQSLLRGFAVVTLVFAAIDFYATSGKREPWNPEKLPKKPKEDTQKISRTGTIAGLIAISIFGVLWIFFLFYNQTYIGWFDDSGNWVVAMPLFNDSTIRLFIPLFIISLAMSIFDNIVKLHYGHWNLQVGIIYTINQVLSIAVFIAFINHPELISVDFWSEIAGIFETTVLELQNGFNSATTGFGVFLALVVAIDLIVTWIKKVKIKPIIIK